MNCFVKGEGLLFVWFELFLFVVEFAVCCVCWCVRFFFWGGVFFNMRVWCVGCVLLFACLFCCLFLFVVFVLCLFAVCSVFVFVAGWFGSLCMCLGFVVMC